MAWRSLHLSYRRLEYRATFTFTTFQVFNHCVESCWLHAYARDLVAQFSLNGMQGGSLVVVLYVFSGSVTTQHCCVIR
eukprot:6020994-Amphidinium_carterae.1